MNTTVISLLEQTQTVPAMQKIAQRLKLKPREFAAAVAFCGIHMTLYPLWIHLWGQLGVELPLQTVDTDPETIGDSDAPWKMIVFSCSQTKALLHVQTKGFSDKPDLFQKMMIHPFRQLIESLDDAGRFVAYAEALPILSEIGCSTDCNVPLDIPMLSLEKLESQFDLWRDWGKQMEPLLYAWLQQLKGDSMIPEKAIELYREFAAVLWQELLQKKVIQAAPLPTGWFSQLKGFRKEIFHGTALLLGDHESFWYRHEKWV